MPSSCSNGICTAGQNDVGKAVKKSAPSNHCRTSHETKHSGKAQRGSKVIRAKTHPDIKPPHQDETHPTGRRQAANQSAVHSSQNLSEQGRMSAYPENAPPTDARVSKASEEPSAQKASETSLSNSAMKANSTIIANTVAPTAYDPSLIQSYLAQVQGFIPGLPCSTPQCSTCYPVLDSSGYISNASSSAVQQPMILSRPILGGMGSGGGTGPASNSCYIWLGQDVEAQKQMYQAQFALSQLNLNSGTAAVPSAYGVPSDFSSNVPLIPPNVATEVTTGAAQLLNSSPHSDASLYAASSLVMPIGAMTANHSQSRAVSESRFPGALPSASSMNYPTGNAIGNHGMGLCIEAPNMDNAMWTNNYLPTAVTGTGTGNLWIPPAYPNYAQPYYPALSVPVASISSPGLVNYEDPNSMQQTTVDRCFSNPAIAVSDKYQPNSQEYYFSPTDNLSSGSVWAGPVKISTGKSFSVLNPSPVFSPSDAQPQVGNNSHWQMLLAALSAQKSNQSVNSTFLRHPLNSYNLHLDRSRLPGGRKRMPINFAARAVPCKEFNPIELQSLNLGVNPVEFDASLLVRARYFIIKSDCEYNVHQSIRHGVWCSTRSGNQCLNDAYESVQLGSCRSFTNSQTAETEQTHSDLLKATELKETNKSKLNMRGHILLFFSVRSSGYLNGVAEMIGPVDPQKRCSIWLDSRFRGEIPVRWLYVKNVPTHLIKHISIESYDNRPVTVLRDTSEITPASKGEELLRIVHDFGLAHPMCMQLNY